MSIGVMLFSRYQRGLSVIKYLIYKFIIQQYQRHFYNLTVSKKSFLRCSYSRLNIGNSDEKKE
jgi:hypothetical protein